MPFKVTVFTAVDEVVFARGTARLALDTTQQLHRAGIQRVEITSDRGKRVTEDQLKHLSRYEPTKIN